MADGTVIEIDGIKITPEFIALIKRHFFPFNENVAELKDYLFDIQTGIIIGLAGTEEYAPAILSDIANALINLKYLCDQVLELKKEGKL